VSVLRVETPALWEELAAHVDLDGLTERCLDETTRVMTPDFDREALPALREAGVRVLVRYARRDAATEAAEREDLRQRVDALPAWTRSVLHRAQRHALDDVVIGTQAWDPEHHAAEVRALFGAGLLAPLPGEDAPPLLGRYRLHPDLPPPPEPAWDFTEAVMDETDDLEPPREPGPVALLHDLASLAAALLHVVPRRTHKETLAIADGRRLGRRLGDTALSRHGRFAEIPRWTLALRALEALGAVSMDPIARTLHLDLALESTLRGATPDAVDRFVHRLVERDLHVVVPAVREALRQAGPGAIDEVVFLDLLREQDREILFVPWRREGATVYPDPAGLGTRPWDDEAWDAVEAPLVDALLARLVRLGVIRRAPGVFAGTPDGRRWAGALDHPHPPVWVTSDLELMVPPDSLTPWERFQLERLGRCLARDVVDRYRLDREGLEQWLSTHELEEALGLLARRCPGVPASVVDTLEAWAASARRVVLTRGELVEA